LLWKPLNKLFSGIKWVPGSLQTRLLWASIVLLPVLIIFAGAALQNAYESSLFASERSQAQLQTYGILGSADLVDGELVLPRRLQEPRFSQVQSGLSGLVFDAQGLLRWQSESSALLDEQFVMQVSTFQPEPGSSRFQHLKDQGFYLYVYPLVWEIEEKEFRYTIAIVSSDATAMEELLAFQRQLWGWLLAVYLLALLLQFLILRWGLKPLDDLADDLSMIEQGEAEKLEGVYPYEVERITKNLNRLIESERSQRERYRNTLGDLAHSLKTPLAVIRGAGEEKHSLASYKRLVDEQSDRMTQIVQYQLSRAVKSKEQAMTGATSLLLSVDRIVNALSRVYAAKEIDVEREGLNHFFAGDERDLMEMLGNLIENAFKYCDHQVRLSAAQEQQWLEIVIENDGQAISTEEHQVVIERGARLDTSRPGQGIGLAVVTDIVSSYNGGIEISQSELGGAEIRLRLPAGEE
jgi:two-component system sensor histidine kinase PhoQ